MTKRDHSEGRDGLQRGMSVLLAVIDMIVILLVMMLLNTYILYMCKASSNGTL